VAGQTGYVEQVMVQCRSSSARQCGREQIAEKARRAMARQAVLALFAALLGCGPDSVCHAQGPAPEKDRASGPEVEFPPGWRPVDSLDKNYSLVFRDDSDLMVLDAADRHPRRVATTPQPAFFGTPSWSADGALMFDTEVQVISIATRNGGVRALSSFQVLQSG
jgi:hypothetical protein